MAPTPSPVLVHSPNHPSGRHPHRHRRQSLNFSHHPPRRPSVPKARTVDVASQPSVVLESPPPPPIAPMPSESVALAPEPVAIPNNQPQTSNQPVELTGNIVAAAVLIVLILGGLIGLVIGGEMLRRRTKTTERRERVYRSSSRCFGRRKSGPIKGATNLPQQHTQTCREKFPYDEKTLTPLTRPPSVLNRERQRRLSDVWPIRSLSMAISNRRSRPLQVERSPQQSLPTPNPKTTWSEFTSVSLYVPPPRTVLDPIPEELEDGQSQTNSDIEAILGVTFQRLLESGNEPRSSQKMLPDGSNGPDSLGAAEGGGLQDRQIVCKAASNDEDAKSLGSSAPEMTTDGGESSRSSTASLESLEDGNDSLREEVFELRRAQTRSMQMNKGVLLSLGSKTLDDNQNPESTHGECGPSRSSSAADVAEGSKEYVMVECGLAMIDGDFSAVNLDEFPSLPSILPMIPSFVSGF